MTLDGSWDRIRCSSLQGPPRLPAARVRGDSMLYIHLAMSKNPRSLMIHQY